jgi:AraC-like DNA-binding protein
MFGDTCPEVEHFIEDMEKTDIGHFNVFDIGQMSSQCSAKPRMPYNRRTYYKISLINGRNRVEYADKTVEITDYAILFATPKIPYRYVPLDQNQQGHFCVFTREFMTRSKTGLVIDELPIFMPNSDFVYRITPQQNEEITYVFRKMHSEIASDYTYKYDLLRNYVIELLHYGQKLKPAEALRHDMNAATRITTLFLELLERQFPLESQSQVLLLRTPKDYADTLNIHVNHLNKVLKEATGKTTTEIIAARVTQEAKILLRQTPWSVSEIAFALGFDEVAHFSNFFKKQAGSPPVAFRN